MPIHEKLEVKVMVKAVVCEDSNLKGDITISTGCVIHPSANILAEGGPIVLGENCIVEEYATIRYPPRSIDRPDSQPQPLIIGSSNVFEVGCKVEAQSIGSRNVFECKSYVGPHIHVSSGCIIGAGVRVTYAQKLPENTVLYGVQECLQREVIEKHGSQTLQIDFLRKVLPNYHHLRKPNVDPKTVRAPV